VTSVVGRGSNRAQLAGVLLVALAMAAVSCSSAGQRAHGSADSASSSPSRDGVRQVATTVGSPPLRATLTLPAATGPFAVVVFMSGSGPNDQDETLGPDKPFRDLALGLAADGIATLRYDKRTRDYPHALNPATFTAVDEYVPDALAAIAYLRRQPGIDPHRIIVLGHSQGGTFAPLVAQRSPALAGVILLAASVEPFGAALLRQTRYLATLPGAIGSQAAAALPRVEVTVGQLDGPSLAQDPPDTVLAGGVGPAYYLSLEHVDPVATARAIPQPLLILQGDRDYEVTVPDDLDVWIHGLAGRPQVTVHQFPAADHLFIDGTGPASPADQDTPAHIDPEVTAVIATWVHALRGTS